MTLRKFYLVFLGAAILATAVYGGIELFSAAANPRQGQTAGGAGPAAANSVSEHASHVSGPATAGHNARQATNPAASSPPRNESCLQQACSQAGYYAGGSVAKRGLLLDCVAPLKAGREVPGLSPQSIDACLRQDRQASQEN